MTEPIEAGGKRQCTRDAKHRVYPRTDPVVFSPRLISYVQLLRPVFCCAAALCRGLSSRSGAEAVMNEESVSIHRMSACCMGARRRPSCW